MIYEIKAEKNENRALIEHRLRLVLDAQGDDICGFAIVVWGRDGVSTADAAVKNSDATLGIIIPPILIPDFVRNRLLGMTIEQWAVEAMQAPDKGTS